MRAYADSSFIVSLYIPEPDRTAAAIAYMEARKEALPFTPQHRLEARNAIRLLVWSKRITPGERTRALKEIEADLDDELFLIHTPIDFTDAFRRADKISAAHNEAIGCRSADFFHIASALELGFKSFLTFDAKQREFAQACGLDVSL